MGKSNILSWLLFLLVSSSCIRTYSFLNWPKVYIPHCGGVYWMSLGIIPFSKIFLNVLFHTLTNNVSFLYLSLHLFKCVALLCIYIIVIRIFNSILLYYFKYLATITHHSAQKHKSKRGKVFKTPFCVSITTQLNNEELIFLYRLYLQSFFLNVKRETTNYVSEADKQIM
jgi:hypothetical protein